MMIQIYNLYFANQGLFYTFSLILNRVNTFISFIVLSASEKICSLFVDNKTVGLVS